MWKGWRYRLVGNALICEGYSYIDKEKSFLEKIPLSKMIQRFQLLNACFSRGFQQVLFNLIFEAQNNNKISNITEYDEYE